MNDYKYIIKYMTQQELIEQCLMLANARDEDINYYEYKVMYEAIKLPDNKYGFRDLESDLYIKLEHVRNRLKYLNYLYE